MRAQSAQPEGHLAATSGGRIYRGSTAIITRTLAALQLDVAGTRRFACQLLDDGFSEREAAAVVGWRIDQVRYAAADRARPEGA